MPLGEGRAPWHRQLHQLQPRLLSSDILTRTRAGSQEAGPPAALTTTPAPPDPASSLTGVGQPVAGPGGGCGPQRGVGGEDR